MRVGKGDGLRIAELVEERTGNDHEAAGPGDVVAIDRPVGRADVGHAPRFLLGVGHVLDPLGIQGAVLEQERLPLRFRRSVPQPTLPFVTLRAIRGNTPIIASHSPDDVLVDPVDHRLRALERPGRFQIVVDDTALDRIQRRTSREPGYFHETKAVIGESRLVDLRPLPLECVEVGHLRTPDVVQVERAVFLERLGVAELHGRARFALNLEAAPADHVLAHVEDEHARLRLGDLHRLERLGHPDRLDHLGNQWSGRGGHQLHALPVAVVKSRTAPARHLLAGVVFLPVKLVVGLNRSVGGQLPGLVADDKLARAVLVVDGQLEQQLGIAVAFHGHRALSPGCVEPPVAEPDSDHVGPSVQLLGHIERQIVNSLRIIRQTRRQNLVADLLAVDVEFRQSQTAEVDRRPSHWPGIGKMEPLAEHASGQATILVVHRNLAPGSAADRAEHFRGSPRTVVKLQRRPV